MKKDRLADYNSQYRYSEQRRQAPDINTTMAQLDSHALCSNCIDQLIDMFYALWGPSKMRRPETRRKPAAAAF